MESREGSREPIRVRSHWDSCTLSWCMYHLCIIYVNFHPIITPFFLIDLKYFSYLAYLLPHFPFFPFLYLVPHDHHSEPCKSRKNPSGNYQRTVDDSKRGTARNMQCSWQDSCGKPASCHEFAYFRRKFTGIRCINFDFLFILSLNSIYIWYLRSN